MHLTDGDIRTYQDNELSLAELRRVQAHLQTCPACQERAASLAARTQRLAARLEVISAAGTADPSHPLPLRLARRQLEQRIQIEPQEKQTMLNKLTARISRPAWAAIAMVAVLAVSLAFPPVRALASDFLRLFRVEQVQVLPVDLNTLPGDMHDSPNLEALFADNVQIDDHGKMQTVADAAAASAASGMTVRLPGTLGQPAELIVQPGGKMQMTLDVELLRGVLSDLGLNTIDLPDSLDGQTVRVTIPAGVAATYGDCPKMDELDQMDEPRGHPEDMETPADLPNCTTFFQMPSPNVEAPDELDVNQLGQAYLQVLGMSPEEAAQFASQVDWTTTFVVPVPRYSTNQKEVTVDGTQGTLINYRENGKKAYALLWVKDGIVYALTGPGDGQTALDIAASLK